MKRSRPGSKAPLIAIVILAAIGVIIGTVAYFTSTQTFTNPFTSAKYSIETYEVFNPEDAKNLLPGAVVDKKVNVANTGTAGALVRIKYSAKENGGEYTDVNPSLAGGTWISSFTNADKFSFNEADNYFYYRGVLGAGASVSHLDAVKLSQNYVPAVAEIGYYGHYASTDGSKSGTVTWVEKSGCTLNLAAGKVNVGGTEYDYYGEKTSSGIQSLSYSLKVTVETVQATDASGNALTVSPTADASELKGYWTALGK